MAFEIEKTKERVLETARKMVDMGLVMGTWGNVSASPEHGVMIITPSGMDYHKTNFADMVMVNYLSKEVEGRRIPSVEVPMHCDIYREMPQVKAIVHTHSNYVLAMAVAGEEIPPITDEMASLVGGSVAVARYATTGSEELGRNVVAALRKSGNAVMMANHGLVAVGGTLDEALMVSVIVEKAAQVYLYARLIGSPRELTAEETAASRRFFVENYGQRRCRE